MAAVIVGIVLLVVFVTIGLWLGERLVRRLAPGQEISLAKRRRGRIIVGLMMVPPALALVAFATGHPAVGIAIVVATIMLPNLATIALQIRRSRSRG